MLLFIACFICLVACTAFAQDRMRAPILGNVLRSDGSLQTIEGVPGAAHFAAAPDRTPYLAFLTASHARTMLTATSTALTVSYNPVQRIALDGRPRAIAISPKARYFGFISDTDLLIFEAHRDTPVRTALSTLLADGADTLSFAISDNGTALVCTTRAASAVGSAGSPLSAPRTLTLPRFLPNSEQAIAFEPRVPQIVSLDATTLNIHTLTAPAADSMALANVNGIEISADSKTVWLSATNAVQLFSYSLETQTTTAYPVTAPGALRPLGIPTVFLWSDTALLDTRRPTPQVLTIASPEVR